LYVYTCKRSKLHKHLGSVLKMLQICTTGTCLPVPILLLVLPVYSVPVCIPGYRYNCTRVMSIGVPGGRCLQLYVHRVGTYAGTLTVQVVVHGTNCTQCASPLSSCSPIPNKSTAHRDAGTSDLTLHRRPTRPALEWQVGFWHCCSDTMGAPAYTL